MPKLPKDTSKPLPKKHWWHRRNYKLQGAMVYVDKDGRTWEVETGFTHNYASVPWPVSIVLPPKGKSYAIASIFHDKHHDGLLFYEMMRQGKTPRWLATLMFIPVSHPPNDPEDVTAGGGDNDSILG